VLTDFGIATLHGDPGLTQAGMVMGTPGFCAPERIRGEPASPASDLWSLGATLYAAVEGRGPFEGQGSAMAVLANIVHGDPPPATSAGQLRPVITALMTRDPAARPDATAARRLLAAACSGYGVGAGASSGAGANARAGANAGATVSGDSARSAGASGDPDETVIPDSTRGPGNTLAFPADQEPAAAVSALAGAGTATTAAAGWQPDHAVQPDQAAQPGQGGQGRRPGRHRRALLIGGSGTTAVR